MNRKRWTKILMGAVCGVMLTAVTATMTNGQNAVETPPSQAPEDPAAFTCEARIGNASASGGEFEYDIGPDTAHPAQLGQFTWPNNQSVSFVIEYDAATRTATYKLGSSQAIQYTVPSGVFDTLNGYADIHLRTRNTDTGRSMVWKDLVVEVWNGTNYEPYDITRNFIGTSMTATNDSRTMMICAVPKMQRGFKVSGNVALAWDPNKPTPARSHINGQISFRERSGVVKVEWVGIQPGTSGESAVEEPLGTTAMTQNPETHGGGIRYFPEKDQPDSNPTDQIRVKVTVGKATSHPRTVVMRIFDMDDPTAPKSYNVSPSDCVIDPVDCQGEAIYGRLIVYGDDNRSAGGEPIGTSLPKGKWGSLAGEEGYVYAVLPANATTADYTFNFWNEDESVWLAPQPGNNWRILAHVLPGGVDEDAVPDSSYLKAMDVDVDWEYSVTSAPGLDVLLWGMDAQNNSASYLAPETIKSPLLTVWRTLHLEVDAMEPMPNQNDPNANPNTVVGNLKANDDGYLIWTSINDKSFVYLDKDLTKVFPHREMDPDKSCLYDDNINCGGRFQGGLVKLGTKKRELDVFANGKTRLLGDFRISVEITKVGEIGTKVYLLKLHTANKTIDYEDIDGQATLSVAFVGGTLDFEGVKMDIVTIDTNTKQMTVQNIPPIPYELHDDDYDFLLGFGNAGEQPRYPEITMASTALSEAYVSLKQISPENNPTPFVPFVLNWKVNHAGPPQAKGAFDNRNSNRENWWCGHIATAYQYTTANKLVFNPETGGVIEGGDYDPNGEYTAVGVTEVGLSQAVVFLEGLVDFRNIWCSLDSDDSWVKSQERSTVVHELGHVLTNWGGEPVVTDDYNYECPRPDDLATKYVPSYLNRIRQTKKPGTGID